MLQSDSLRKRFPLETNRSLKENVSMKKLLLTLLISSPVFANELTLYVIPSPGLDWSSPKNLFLSAAKNKMMMKSHFMGHMWVELKCADKTELTGMIGDNPDFINQLVMNSRGLGVFYHSFPGKLETDVARERDEYLKNGGMNFIRFVLNQGQCQRATQYLTEFRKNNVGRNYGLAHRPRHAEGAGCSAFAVSFPDVVNVMDQEMKETWIDEVKIQRELAGPPVNNEGVSILKIITADKWATDSEKHEVLRFWNPDKIYNYINNKVNKPMSGYKVSKLGNVSGIEFDKSHLPLPLEPIWQQQIDPKDKTKTAVIVPPVRPPKKNQQK